MVGREVAVEAARFRLKYEKKSSGGMGIGYDLHGSIS